MWNTGGVFNTPLGMVICTPACFTSQRLFKILNGLLGNILPFTWEYYQRFRVWFVYRSLQPVPR
jgi:hypothetical protein